MRWRLGSRKRSAKKRRDRLKRQQQYKKRSQRRTSSTPRNFEVIETPQTTAARKRRYKSPAPLASPKRPAPKWWNARRRRRIVPGPLTLLSMAAKAAAPKGPRRAPRSVKPPMDQQKSWNKQREGWKKRNAWTDQDCVEKPDSKRAGLKRQELRTGSGSRQWNKYQPRRWC